MTIPNQQVHGTRVAINTVTLANMVAVVTRATAQVNTDCVSSNFNGESLTTQATASMAEAMIREKLSKLTSN